MQADSKTGKVVVAPEVLLTIVQQTVLSSPGVIRLFATWPENIGKFLGIRTVAEGLAIQVEDDALNIDVHIVADADAQMLEMGRHLQNAINRAIQEIVGLEVKAVNVHIEGVEQRDEDEPEKS